MPAIELSWIKLTNSEQFCYCRFLFLSWFSCLCLVIFNYFLTGSVDPPSVSCLNVKTKLFQTLKQFWCFCRKKTVSVAWLVKLIILCGAWSFVEMVRKHRYLYLNISINFSHNFRQEWASCIEFQVSNVYMFIIFIWVFVLNCTYTVQKNIHSLLLYTSSCFKLQHKSILPIIQQTLDKLCPHQELWQSCLGQMQSKKTLPRDPYSCRQETLNGSVLAPLSTVLKTF